MPSNIPARSWILHSLHSLLTLPSAANKTVHGCMLDAAASLRARVVVVVALALGSVVGYGCQLVNIPTAVVLYCYEDDKGNETSKLRVRSSPAKGSCLSRPLLSFV